MVTLFEDIQEKVKEALKARDQIRLESLRSIIAAGKNEMVAAGKPAQASLSDEEVLGIIRRLVKQRKDSISQFEQAGRADLVSIEREQLGHLEAFLPALMSEDDIRTTVKSIKEKMGVIDTSKMGVVVGAVMKELAGKADGAVVKRIVTETF